VCSRVILSCLRNYSIVILAVDEFYWLQLALLADLRSADVNYK